MKRTLSLKSETLTLLTNDELSAMAGAASIPNCIAIGSLPLTICVSLIQECPTGYNCGYSYDSECSCLV